jgi:hypothetical protein
MQTKCSSKGSGLTSLFVVLCLFFIPLTPSIAQNECSSAPPIFSSECGVEVAADCDPRPNNDCAKEAGGGSSWCQLDRPTIPVCRSIPPDPNVCPAPDCPDNETYEVGTVTFYKKPGCVLTDEPDRVESWYECGC